MAIKRWSEFHRTPTDKVHQTLLDYMNEAQHSLHLSVYGFTNDDMGDILIAKHRAGLEVGVVSDHTQAGGKAQHALLQRLVDAGVPVTIATSPTGAINHVKCIICEAVVGADANESYAIFGSLNFSGSGEKQENNFTAMNDPVIVADLYQQYIEARDVGAKHPDWQLHPNTSQPPTVPPDVAAAGTPPEDGDAAPS